jgi:hypothetical protein
LCYMTTSTAAAEPQPHGKLQAGHGSSAPESAGLSSMFNGLSVVIWSMIAAKAKTGYSAANNGQAKTVGEHLKYAGTLIAMIALASGFNIYAQMEDATVQGSAPTAALEAGANMVGHALQSGHGRKVV